MCCPGGGHGDCRPVQIQGLPSYHALISYPHIYPHIYPALIPECACRPRLPTLTQIHLDLSPYPNPNPNPSGPVSIPAVPPPFIQPPHPNPAYYRLKPLSIPCNSPCNSPTPNLTLMTLTPTLTLTLNLIPKGAVGERSFQGAPSSKPLDGTLTLTPCCNPQHAPDSDPNPNRNPNANPNPAHNHNPVF